MFEHWSLVPFAILFDSFPQNHGRGLQPDVLFDIRRERSGEATDMLRYGCSIRALE